MTALTRNDPDELGIIKQSLRQVLAGILPRGSKDDSDNAGS
jgi:pyruvate dehydrogenase (quinone)